MPQLEKFTYFTQFFWSCLLLFTFSLPFVLYLLVGRKERISGLRNESSKTKRTGLFQMRLRKCNIVFLYWLLKPLVRFTMGFAYFVSISNLFLYGNALMEVFPSFLLSFDSIEYNSGSSSGWTSFDIGVLLEPEPMPPLEPFRAQNAHMEEALFSRIRNLEAQLAHGLPPQLNAGDYARLVRENFESAVSVDHYRETLNLEFWEVYIMEKKIQLQDLLFHRMMAEPGIAEILNQSPYGDIRSAAFEFIEEKVEPVSAMQHSFQRNLLEGTVTHLIRDVEQNGSRSVCYREFVSYFADEQFRRLRYP